MIRVNLNIAIVAMVKSRGHDKSNISQTSECLQATTQETIAMNETNGSLLIQNLESRFDWDEHQQSLILGGFFWFHWVLQVPGGILAQRYGTKLVFGLSNWIGCLLAALIPACASINYQAIVVLRVLQGIITGAAWPSMHTMAASWIPPNERSKFVTAYLGSSVGAAVTFPMCGFLIEWFDWPSVFYTTGVLGTMWYLAWYFIVFDTPAKHPRIAESERTYIESSLGYTVTKKKPPIPWKSILTSVPMWMNIFAQWGGIWGLFTLLTQAPTFFRYIHGMNVRMTGILSGIPHLCRVIVAIIVSFFGDYALKKEILSRTAVRKVATTICTLFNGLFVLGLAYSGCNSVAAIICLTLSVSCSGAVSTGPLASLVDIGPNFAGVVLGITNMITVAPGFISPIIVGKLTYQNQTSGQWQVVFLISAIMLFIAGILYLLFSSSDVQPWNSSSIPEKEMKVLNSKEPAEEEEKLKLNNETVPDTENNCP
ncbi:sialin isoform X2 [Anabrus simplex]